MSSILDRHPTNGDEERPLMTEVEGSSRSARTGVKVRYVPARITLKRRRSDKSTGQMGYDVMVWRCM